jgi:hypothetical protein
LKSQRKEQPQDWLLNAPCKRLQRNEVPLEFRLMAAGVIWDKVLDHVRIDARKTAWQEVMRQGVARRLEASENETDINPTLIKKEE